MKILESMFAVERERPWTTAAIAIAALLGTVLCSHLFATGALPWW